MKLAVIGLDGASFELIDPWIEEGYLPNIAKIKQQGAWADMRSVLPPVTSPNWKCFSTGKNPSKVGIFWWENIDWRNRKVYYPASRKTSNKEIWDYLSEAGSKVGVVGMPTTYPPKKVNGFLILGDPDAPDSGFAYPRSIENELKALGWKVRPVHLVDVERGKAASEIHQMIDNHFQTAHDLAHRWEVDFLMLATFNINTLHHFLWDAPETRKGWEIIDRHIGRFMDEGWNMLIMSDHGSNKIESVFNINTWLEKEGYLKLQNSFSNFLYKIGINRERLLKAVSSLGLMGFVRKVVPKRLYGNIPSVSGEVGRESKTGKVDWKRSKALASGQGPIYLNPDNQDNASLRDEIKGKLESLVDPRTGKKVIEKVYTREEIYNGEYLAEAPDLIIDQAKGVHIPGGIGQRSVFDTPCRWEAENKKHGLLMAFGPAIKHGGRIENVSILDLAPSILYLMGAPIPPDMDGKVLSETISPLSSSKITRVMRGKSKSQREQDRIRKGVKRVHTRQSQQ